MHSVASDSVIPSTVACQTSGVDGDPIDCSLPDFPGKSTGVGCYPLLQGIEPRSPALQADSLLSEPPGNELASTESAGTGG